MRFSDLPLTTKSLALTAAFAAVVGAASAFWPSPAPIVASGMPVQYEEMTIEAPVVSEDGETMSICLVPSRPSFARGENVRLEARLTNVSNMPMLASSDGAFDLLVRRVSSPEPMGGNDLTFMTLTDAAQATPAILQPGQSLTRSIEMGPERPFDVPGRYIVSGQWHGSVIPVAVIPFEVNIGPRRSPRGVSADSLLALGIRSRDCSG